MCQEAWKILIVEADASRLAALRELLADAWVVFEASTGESAVAGSAGMDCLILSGDIADTGALAVLNALPKNRLATLVITAVPPSREMLRKLLHAGVSELLCRVSLTPEILVQTVGTAIERHSVHAGAFPSANCEPCEPTLRAFYDRSELMMGVVELADDDSKIIHIFDNPAATAFLARHDLHDEGKVQSASQRGVPLASQEIWIQHYRQSQQSGAPVRFEYLHPGENPLWLASIVTHVGTSSNGRARFSYITDNITPRKLAEECRGEDEKRLALTLHAGQLGFWDWHIPSGAVVFGGQWAKMLGYSDEEIDPKVTSWQRLLHPDESDEVLGILAAHLEGRTEFYECEYRLRHKDGSWRWVLDRGLVVERDADGHPIRALGTHADVTPRKHVQENLRDSEERFRLLVESSSLAVWEAAPDGLIHTHSPSWPEFSGQSPEESLADGWTRLVHPDDLDAVYSAWRASVHAEAIHSGTFRMRRKDGTWRWTRVLAAPLRDADGRLVKWVGMNTDITEQKETEERLRESESFYRQTIESVPGTSFTCTPEGFCDFISHQWIEFTGAPLEDHLDHGWIQFIHPEDSQSTAAAWQAAVENLAPYDLQYRVRRYDGNYEWFKVRGTPIRDSAGKIVRWFGGALNVDDLVNAENALRAADRRKDQFLAMLAHELRNPLAPILNAVEILRLTHAAGHSPDAFHDVIERQVRHLSLLVDDLLDVSRVSTGKIHLNKAPLDLVHAVEQAVEIHQPFITARRHQLTLILPAEPVPILGDSVRISQIIGNLLNNAAKYSEPNSRIDLIVETDSPPDTQPSAVLRVRDNGRGIDQDSLPLIFNLFFQDGRTLDRSEGGLGLGLSLVQSLVHLHGGSIEAHSAGLGHGCEFTIRLPLAAQIRLPAVPFPLPVPATVPRSSRILVVDDNPDLANGMTHLLRLKGHSVLTATNGQQAVEMAIKDRPEVILMDIGLPKLNGYDACRAMRHAGLLETLIVAITGYGQAHDRALSEQASFDAHLVKPVDLNTVLDLIERHSAQGLKV
jgi:PAS domain S-box-containing protein